MNSLPILIVVTTVVAFAVCLRLGKGQATQFAITLVGTFLGVFLSAQASIWVERHNAVESFHKHLAEAVRLAPDGPLWFAMDAGQTISGDVRGMGNSTFHDFANDFSSGGRFRFIDHARAVISEQEAAFASADLQRHRDRKQPLATTAFLGFVANVRALQQRDAFIEATTNSYRRAIDSWLANAEALAMELERTTADRAAVQDVNIRAYRSTVKFQFLTTAQILIDEGTLSIDAILAINGEMRAADEIANVRRKIERNMPDRWED